MLCRHRPVAGADDWFRTSMGPLKRRTPFSVEPHRQLHKSHYLRREVRGGNVFGQKSRLTLVAVGLLYSLYSMKSKGQAFGQQPKDDRVGSIVQFPIG